MTAHHGPKRVGPRLHCVDIAWQVQGRCVGSVVHSPPHTIAARALSAARTIKPLPMHFACVHALGVPHTHSAVCALCVGSCTLQPAHLAVHALILVFFHAIFNPFNLRSNQITINNERIRQCDSSDTGHSDNVNIAAEHQEPAEVLSQLDNTSNSPVYGEYKCC